MCAPEAQEGDIVVALFGSGVPFVLRPLDADSDSDSDSRKWPEGKVRCWRFIGECYIHGNMNSAYLDKLMAEEADEELFHMI
jgi:hypothetical protein